MTNWQPSALKLARHQRAGLYQYIRSFFAERGVLEVETPLLSRTANSDPAIESFEVGSGECARYLRTSPEFPLKRLLASCNEAVYELGRVFRCGEKGRWHNPEFTMLEWYRPGWDHRRLADEVVELLIGRLSGLGRLTVSYRQVFLDNTGVDPFHHDDDFVINHAESAGAPAELNRQQALDYLLSVKITPTFDRSNITVITDFPAEQAALARIDPSSTQTCQRFEVYLGASELANGYHELTDAQEHRQRFEDEQARRLNNGQMIRPLDQSLLSALDAGLAPCAGVALGVDRWLMILGGYKSIDQVLNFEWERA